MQVEDAAAGGNRLSDPLPIGVWLSIVGLLILINGFLVTAQHLLIKGRMELLAKGKSGKVEWLLQRAMSKRPFYAKACQLGITVVSLSIGWAGAHIAVDWTAPWLSGVLLINKEVAGLFAWFLVFIILAALHFVMGQTVPKSISVQTEDDFRMLLKESHRKGHIDVTEFMLVDNIFEFAETTAREIMIPRTEMICLHIGLTLEANKTIAMAYMRTRYPVCEHDKDNIIGFIHIKDLLKHSPGSNESLLEWVRPITTVPDSIPISSLLKLMQKKQSQIAILIDEYGGTSGLVTLEDIMEEIVGDIRDEFDPDRVAIVKHDDGTYSISGLALIEEVNSFFGTDIGTDQYDTIGGWIYSRIGFTPMPDQSVYCDGNVEFQIEEMQHLRITQIRVKTRAESPENIVRHEEKRLGGKMSFPD
ncbi:MULTISPECIES: hemolysin family protein [unclassified Paenibacillus]|uniref:hemolysin family protein n=1 Tax=unclassified Paenibacillus TaxID=185978 RepID=UPI0036D37820